MGLFTLLARCLFAPRKRQSLADRLAAAPLAPTRLERRRVLDASAAGVLLTPLTDSSEFVQVGEQSETPPLQAAAVVANGVEENTPPENLQISPLDDVFENDFAQLAFTFDDPDFQDAHTVEINWGDGTPTETINLDPGDQFVQTSHQYLDDNPTKMPSDTNTVQVTVTDSYGEEVSGSAPINVGNVAPTIDSLMVTSPVDENGIAELQLTFTDPGLLDTHTVEIDWGDGTPIETINLLGGERFLQTSHQYLDDNTTKMPSDINTVKVTVTDDDMGSDTKMTDITVNNVAPTIDSLTVSSPVNENGVAQLQLTFTDPGLLDTHTVEIDWGDGTPTETINLLGGERFLQTSHQYLDDNPTKMPSDINTVKVTVTDDDMESDTKMTDITVNNIAPTIDSLMVTSPVDENGIAELQLTFTDPGLLDTHTVEIGWGDGTPIETINLLGGERFLQTSHQYLDDNPTKMPSDINTVKVTVTDDDMESDTKMMDITVNNVAPVIDSLTVTSPVNENDFAELQLTFTDPGLLDTHTVEIDWGDGTPIETINLLGGERFLQTSHQYLDDNPTKMPSDINTVKVTVTDDDMGSDTKMMDITVNNVSPVVTIEDEPVSSPEGTEISLTSTLTDPGTLDTFTYTWEVKTNGNIYASGATPNFSFTPADNGVYVVTLTVEDDDMGVGSDEVMIDITNVAPTLDPVGNQMTLEGSLFSMTTMTFSDPGFTSAAAGTMETFTYDINWGDGTVETTLAPSGVVNGSPGTPTTGTIDDDHVYADNGTYTVTVTVYDDDGDSSTQMFDVKVDNVNVDPELNPIGDQETLEGDLFQMATMTFSDPGFTSESAGTVETFTYNIDWGDGSPVEMGKAPSSVMNGSPGMSTTGTIDDSHIYADNGVYTVTVTVIDDDLGSDFESFEVTVGNVDPILAGTDSIPIIFEGQEFTLAELGVQIQDQGFDNPDNPNEQPGGSMETFVGMKVVWGDGTEDVLMVDNASRIVGGPNMPTLADFIHTPHTYADNGPDTTGGTYTVEITVRDDDGGFVTRSFEIQVDNVLPTLTLTTETLEINEGDQIDLSDGSLFGLLGSFNDPGFDNPGNVAYAAGESFELFTYSINWGDDTAVDTMLIPPTRVSGSPGTPTQGTLSGVHTYVDNDGDNFFTITVTLTDDDGGTVQESIQVRVNNVNPSLDPLIATEVNNKGETTLTLTFDDPGTEAKFLEAGQSPFTVQIDWGDMLDVADPNDRFVPEILHPGPTPMTFIVTHKYDGPPDPLHPAADIVISVKIQDDDFFRVDGDGNHLVSEIGESNVETIAITNPGTGTQPFRIDTTPQVPRLEFRREVRNEFTYSESNVVEVSQQNSNLRAVSSDSKATTESVLELRVIDSYDVESEGIRLKPEMLNNLPKLFSKLPDNHYAIYLVRVETNTERLVIEVYVRNGKVIDPSDDSEGTRDRPPTDEATHKQTQEVPEKTGTKPDRATDVEEIRRALEAELDPNSEILIEPANKPDDQGAMLPAHGLLPVAAGLVATRSFGTWALQVDRALAQAGPKKWRELRRRSRKNRKNR